MGRLLLACMTACAAAGCIDWDSLYDARDAQPTDSDSAPGTDAPPNPVGCSDGTAEALLAESGLAACAGAWSIPGVVDDSGPACERAAGNDGRNPLGEGCAVADLCAAGWHVCRDAADVSAHGGDDACSSLQPPDPEGGDSFIYLTRQRGGGPDGQSCSPDGSDEAADDAWGCGTLGLEAVDCKPLDRHLSITDEGGGCGEPYDCGIDPAAEGLHVTKREPALGGGVLCCSDTTP